MGDSVLVSLSLFVSSLRASLRSTYDLELDLGYLTQEWIVSLYCVTVMVCDHSP